MPQGKFVSPDEVVFRAVRSQGAGGQNVNKVASAVVLFFDIRRSSLPEEIKDRLLQKPDSRINKDGVVVIKAQQHRSQDMNRSEALQRLEVMIQQAARVRKSRRPTRPSLAAKENRLKKKTQRSRVKGLRGKVRDEG